MQSFSPRDAAARAGMHHLIASHKAKFIDNRKVTMIALQNAMDAKNAENAKNAIEWILSLRLQLPFFAYTYVEFLLLHLLICDFQYLL